MEPPPDCSSHYIKNDDYFPPITHSSSSKRNENGNGSTNGDFLDISAKTGHFGFTKTDVSQPSTRKTLDKIEGNPSVRSSAIIAYSATKNNAMFSHLAPETNLNLAPSNWLRKTVGLRPETVLPGGRYSSNPNRSFSGFSMASGHLDSVGKVDVVSDAENIKKLLKMPYNKAHVSMAIHRIGRTLLLENFDIKRFTAEESEWEWFRNFYQELVQQQQGSNTLFKKKSPSSQYERLMLSKFLYYSIYKDSLNKIEDKTQENEEFSPTEKDFSDNKETKESNVKLIEIDEECLASLGSEEEKIKELSSSLSSCNSSTSDDKAEQNDEESKRNSAIVTSDRRWRYWTPHESFPTPDATEAFERNISWTFEDLQMLLGTNMPIFGGGKYPAVSLRLRDSNKPINILTGIDYWLDNLICNVPELVMCFHVNGIVQNYEVIKTEDIPKLDHSSFSPQVVKDIAQNILSFLKSNCTKEGHTYWLFKGSGDDVVKLYDLTTLCDTNTSDIGTNRRTEQNLQKNPYIFSVAMLLYRTAISLMQSRDTCDHRITVKKLLIQCIDLLDRTKYQYIVSSAICMLSTLFLPDPNLDRPAKEGTTTKEQDSSPSPGSVDWKGCDTCTAHHDTDLANSRKNSEGPRNAEVASIPSVTDLSIPERYQPISASFDLIKSPSRNRRQTNDEQNGQVEESCNTVLSYVVSGLEVLVPCYRLEWQQSLLCQLIRNAALAYFRLAEQASNLGKFGRALRRSKLALQSYETFDYLSGDIWNPNNNTERRPPDFHLLLPRMLSLCGEIQFSLVEDIKSHGAVSLSHIEELNSLTENDEKIRSGLSRVLPTEGKYSMMTQMSSEIDQALLNCSRCYETALNVMREFGPINKDGTMRDSAKNSSRSAKDGRGKGKGKSKRTNEPLPQPSTTPNSTPPTQNPTNPTQKQAELIWALRTVLTRRHGHCVNELGASALNRAVSMISSSEPSAGDNDTSNKKIWDCWNEAKAHFEAAHLSFAQVNDIINEALVLSNMGRLMRVSAQFYSNNEQGQLSKQERQCFFSAIEKYGKALSILGPKDSKHASCPIRSDTGVSTCTAVYDNISWELSSSYFNMAQILQENAPEDQQASEEAEKEIISWMNNSLKYCKYIWEKTPKQSVALYRQSKIHYRLASLHHNSYRNCTDAHRCKQLRNLAEKNYNKSIAILEALDEHPYEMLRVQLERMALKEHQITSLNSVNQKLKLLFEGLHVVLECEKPLRRVEKSTKVATKDSLSSQVDSREQLNNSEIDPSNISEMLGLLGILATILRSFLLLIVRFMKITGYEHETSFVRRRQSPGKLSQQNFKELYSRTLRSLQQINVPEEEDSSIDGSHLVLQENVSTVLNVLKDISEVLGK
uniref:erythroid differentiation-related factor 1-like n=1 Tax=Styela clava TaxID=7725 RepID=UPI001939B98D|nr:erythroid differentiation-related factor 1-like [Styela clava]